MDRSYRPRLADDAVAGGLDAHGAIRIRGPPGCGITRTGMHHAETSVASWEDGPGGFVLRGPSETDGVTDVRMRPMSLYESGESSGAVSLRSLLDGGFRRCVPDAGYERLAGTMVRGGWPEAVADGHDDGRCAGRIVDGICRDLGDGVRRDPDRVRAVLTAVASFMHRSVPLTAVAERAGIELESVGKGISGKTAASYLDALTDACIVDSVPAYRLGGSRVTPRRIICDPSSAAALRGYDRRRLREDPGMMGRLFHALCFRDLMAYADHAGAEVLHYEGADALSVDAVVDAGDGSIGIAAFSLSYDGAEGAARRLLRMERRMDEPPSFKVVLTGVGYAHVRGDGVAVVPIWCLGPRWARLSGSEGPRPFIDNPTPCPCVVIVMCLLFSILLE